MAGAAAAAAAPTPAELRAAVQVDEEGRVVYPTLDDVIPQTLARGVVMMSTVNMVVKVRRHTGNERGREKVNFQPQPITPHPSPSLTQQLEFRGQRKHIQEAMRACSQHLAVSKPQHMSNVPGAKKQMVFFTGRMISTAAECRGSSLMSIVTFVHLLNRMLSEKRGLDDTRTFVTAVNFVITNIVGRWKGGDPPSLAQPRSLILVLPTFAARRCCTARVCRLTATTRSTTCTGTSTRRTPTGTRGAAAPCTACCRTAPRAILEQSPPTRAATLC